MWKNWLTAASSSAPEQAEENTRILADPPPLTLEELALLRRAADIVNGSVAIPCTGCSYCINKCPKNIAIPKYFALYNADMQELESKSWTVQTMLYSHFSEQYGKAGECIGCGQCEKLCPQHLPIRQWLKKVAERFEGLV